MSTYHIWITQSYIFIMGISIVADPEIPLGGEGAVTVRLNWTTEEGEGEAHHPPSPALVPLSRPTVSMSGPRG